ncbi:MAG: hypothetical protein RLZZ516_2382 [Cyanobacteriota bacterium]|jgi:type IV pilus assembly protein PilA
MSRLVSRRTALPQDGFTLMELLTVVVIMGILAAIATPTILNQQSRARVIAANSTALQSAQSCASLQVTGQETQWTRDPNIAAAATCPTSGTAATFTTSYTAASGITTEAVATLTSGGSASLTTCAVGPGAALKPGAAAPKCEY